MSSIAYNGHDFSEYVTAELVEPAGHALEPRALSVPGRPGAVLLGSELPPRVLRVRLFLDAGVTLTAEERSEIRHELYGWLVAPSGAELSLSGEPDLTWRERDPAMTREDVAWGVATALAVLLCLGMLPFVPLLWLVGKLDS